MSSGDPLVSVVMAAYNAAAYIEGALASVQDQTFTDWEVVVCDDGSRDGTAAIVQAFGARVRLVRHQTNEGLANARNSAIAAARGKLIALLDADDRWLPTYLERQLARLVEAEREGRRVGVVTCNAYLREGEKTLPGTYAERFGSAAELTLAKLFGISPIFISALIPAAALAAVGPFAEGLRRCEDLDLWIRLLEAGYEVIVNPEPLVLYAVRPGQLSASSGAMAAARRQVYERALARGRLGPKERKAAMRAIRRERAVEEADRLWEEWRNRSWHPLRALRTVGLLARAVIENPAHLRHRLRAVSAAGAPWHRAS